MRSKHNSKRIRTLRRRRLALALVTAMAAPLAMAQNLPDSGSVTSGGASIVGTGNQMTITQTGIEKGTIIDWGSFNIGVGYGVTFNQLGADSVTLNRVVGYGNGPGMSLIDGTLTSNGNVFIINPAGIVFGSGAQVNVGGLVASTLNIDNGDFLAGVASGQYRFTASGSVAGGVWNNGQLTAANGGTIGLIGSQINNAGTISTANGSVVFGATRQVTLDYFGDGLTQVTVSGNGLGVSNCSLNCNGGITSSGNVYAQGGHIEMRSNTMDGQSAGNGLFVDPANGGRIWISGNVSAQTSGSRRGSVVIDAGMGNIDLGGVPGKTGNVSTNASNPGEQAGTIQIRGNQLFTHLCVWTNGACENNNQLGFINASTYGAGGLAGGTINIDVARLYHAGVFQASSATGAGGTININANSAEIYNLVFAEGYGGPGGSININANSLLLHRGITPWIDGGPNYSLATLSAFGSTSGGTVNINAGSLSMIDLGTVSPDDVNLDPAYRPTINVNGYGGNGGTINVTTSSFNLSSWQYFEATGTQAGGNIAITANAIDLAGGLVATGATGGTVTTTTTGSLFAGATAYINAGTWLVHAPSIEIVPTSGAVSGPGAVLTDGALSSTLDGGTSVQLYADAALGSGGTGNIRIDSGVNIVHTTGDAAALDLRATAGIYGSYFDIQSTGGPLDLSFTANVNGGNPGDGYVSFFYANLISNGGDIAMNGDGSGVYLEFSQVSSGAGDISISGNGVDNGVLLQQTTLTSTGGDISIDASSVNGAAARLDNANISSGGGNIVISGDGSEGIVVAYSDLTSAGGDILINGNGIYSGAYFHDSIVDSVDGDIVIIGTASLQLAGAYPFGVALAGTTLASTTGDISVVGDAIGGSGILFWTPGTMSPGITTTSGAISLTSNGANGLGLEGLDIATDTGDITIVGTASSADATAAVFVDSGGLTTNGGNINITGTGAATGVWLYGGDIASNGGDITVTGEGFHYGVQVWDNLVSSGTGDIAITGTATGGDSIGVNVRDATFASTSGGITINGSAALGTGVFFGSTGYGPGSSVTTTSGAISVMSTGLFGLRAADVPFNTDTGDIRLEGHASGSAAGVFIGSGGLTTNGGDITLVGSSATDHIGVRVSGGDLVSNGGNITIDGIGFADRGVIIESGEVNSGGGAITITGVSDSHYGASLLNANILSAGGAVSITGTTGANNALVVGGSSVINSGGGDINLTGDAANSAAIVISYSEIQSGGGDIFATATAANRALVMFGGSDMTSGAGDITLFGNGGIEILGSALASTSGNISLDGDSATNAGIVLSGDIATTSGAITLNSTGLSGLSLSSANIDTDTGDITLEGHALGSGFGLQLGAGGLDSNGGDITLIGSSVDSTGLFVNGADIASGGGDISLIGSSTNRAGTQISGSDIDSAGGNIAIHGEGPTSTGLIVSGANISSGAGSISLSGTGGGFGAGVSIGQGSSISTTSGDMDIDGVSSTYIGVLLNVGDVTTTSGNIAITGTGGTVGVRLASGDLATTSGDINITGNAPLGAGVTFGSAGGTVSGIATTSGAISVISTGLLGLNAADVLFSTDTGDITLEGHALGSGFGLSVGSARLMSNGGDITLIGSSVNSTGVLVIGGDIVSGGGDISIEGASTYYDGVRISDSNIVSLGGDITIDGESQNGVSLTYGVVIDSGSSLASSGGDIAISGSSAGGSGVWLEYMDLTTSGGDIALHGTGGQLGGVDVFQATVNSGGGDIEISGTAGTATGVSLAFSSLTSGNGSIAISGDNASSGSGAGVLLLDANLTSTAGNIALRGVSLGGFGIAFDARGGAGSSITTTSGDISLFGQGASLGILTSGAVVIGTQGGDIALAGMGGTGAGLHLSSGTSIDAEAGVVALSASNAGFGDAIILQGSIASTTGVNLRPLNEASTILLGAGNGFSLSSADLARIDAPLLVIGSAQHKGAIRVTEAVDWDDDLTLQNAGGSGGIDIQAAVDVGDNTLALVSGGNISQTAAGGITAHSLLAIAGGDVTLTAAQNNVAATSIAGSAGGDFAYQDMDDLAIGAVSSFGFSALDNAGFVALSATGIAAGDSVLVRTATGNLTLGADVSGSNIDLVAAGLFFNPVGASLTASNGWRIYASTPDGEQRGGLQGDGPFDVFGCSFGDQGCLFLGEGNQFIYKERRLLLAPIAPEAVAELFDDDDLDGTSTDLLIAELCPVADTGDLLQSATGKDELAQEWMKTRRRLQLSNCIDNQNVPGCRF